MYWRAQGQEKEGIYDICDLVGIFSGQQENIIAEKSVPIFHYKYFEPSRFREMVRSLEDCEKIRKCQMGIDNDVQGIIQAKFCDDVEAAGTAIQ